MNIHYFRIKVFFSSKIPTPKHCKALKEFL